MFFKSSAVGDLAIQRFCLVLVAVSRSIHPLCTVDCIYELCEARGLLCITADFVSCKTQLKMDICFHVLCSCGNVPSSNSSSAQKRRSCGLSPLRVSTNIPAGCNRG